MKSQTVSNIKRQTRSHKSIYLGCFYSFFVNGGIALILGAILPYIKSSYELDYVIAGILLVANSVGNLIASFTGGIVPIYLGRRRSILLFCSAGVLGFVLMTITSNPFLLVMAFFLTGVNRGAVSNFNNTVINEIAKEKGAALNILHSVFAIGAFLSPFIAMAFVSRNADGWKYIAYIWALLCFFELFTYGFMNIPNNKPMAKEKKSKMSNLDFLKNKYYLTACAILFFYLCAEQAVNGWLVTYFIESGILSNDLAQTMASLLWLVILFGRLLTAYLSSKVKKSKLLLINALGYVVFFTVLLLSRSVVPVILGIVGVGFCMSGLYPTTVASIGKILKEYPIGLSFMMVFSGLGATLMPGIVGGVAEKIGILGGMSTVIVAVILTLFFIIYNAYINRGVEEDAVSIRQ